MEVTIKIKCKDIATLNAHLLELSDGVVIKMKAEGKLFRDSFTDDDGLSDNETEGSCKVSLKGGVH